MVAAPSRLSLLAGATGFGTALGAVGLTLALVGLGLPFLAAALLSGCIAGLIHALAASALQPRPAPTPDTPPATDLAAQLDAYRTHTASLRHDLRGVLSPALMMSDRLLKHGDPAVQRAGSAVVKSIDRATALLAESKSLMAPDQPPE
jgi:hypothetical protein